MLSNEPPEDAGGGEAVCCGEDATGLTGAAGVLWTLKSDRDAISLSSSKVADVAEGFTEPVEDGPDFEDLSSFLVLGN